MYGTVTPPNDLEPAIKALTDKGRRYLNELCEGREVKPADIAKAADFERDDGES